MEATTSQSIDAAEIAHRLPPAPAGTLEGPVYQADAATTARILSEFGFLPDNLVASPGRTAYPNSTLGLTREAAVVASGPVFAVAGVETEPEILPPILAESNRTVSVADLVTSGSAVADSRSAPSVSQRLVYSNTVPGLATAAVDPTTGTIIEHERFGDSAVERGLVDPNAQLPTQMVEAFVRGRIVWKRRTLTLQNQFLYTRKKPDDEFYQRRCDLTYSTFAADVGASKKFAVCIDNPVPFNRIRLAFDNEATRAKWVTLFMAYKQRQLIKVGAVLPKAVPQTTGSIDRAFAATQPGIEQREAAIAPIPAIQTVPAQHIVPNMGSILHSNQTGQPYVNRLPITTENLIPKPLPDRMTFQPAVYTDTGILVQQPAPSAVYVQERVVQEPVSGGQPVNLQEQLERDLEQREILERLHQTNLAQAPIST